MDKQTHTMICDYEGSDYKSRFWQNADRAYEDAAERVAVRRLLPARGRRLIELGAGFGRLANLYTSYDEIILLDYSRTLLEQAMEQWGSDPRFKYVAANIYHLPFANDVMSTVTMIRVMHHISDVRLALAEIRRIVAPGGTFVLEFANKRNLKSIARFALHRQSWNPFALEPVEFVTLNFDFHPGWMLQLLRQAGFVTRRTLSVSYLRAGVFKRMLPVSSMVYADAVLQLTAPMALLSPSVFTKNVRLDNENGSPQESIGDSIFRSPLSGAPLRREDDALVCDADGSRWLARGPFYDFKERL